MTGTILIVGLRRYITLLNRVLIKCQGHFSSAFLYAVCSIVIIEIILFVFHSYSLTVRYQDKKYYINHVFCAYSCTISQTVHVNALKCFFFFIRFIKNPEGLARDLFI